VDLISERVHRKVLCGVDGMAITRSEMDGFSRAVEEEAVVISRSPLVPSTNRFGDQICGWVELRGGGD